MAGERAEGVGGGGAERTRSTTTITGIKPRVALVRNSHIDRALRMGAGEGFESSWSSMPVPSALVLRSISLTLSLSRSVSSVHASGPDNVGRRSRWARDKIIQLTMRQTRPEIYPALLQNFSVAVLQSACLFGFFDSPSFRLSRRENGFFARSSK